MRDRRVFSISISFPLCGRVIMDDEFTIDALIDYHYRILDSLDGVGKMRFIDGVLDDYMELMAMRHPKQEQRQYRELLTDLVKNFGH